MAYLPRIVDEELSRRLKASGAVVVEGPKACGKTATARQQAASEALLDTDARAQAALAVDPSLLLEGKTPRLLDEWQIEPSIWNHVRRAVDDRETPGQFILTGSSVPPDDETRHSGAGRFSRLRMRPMSLAESGASSSEISLAGLLDGNATTATQTDTTLDDLIELVVRGGWPGLRQLELADAARANRDYVDQTRRTDISAVDGVQRDPERVGAVMRSLARHTASQATISTIARDVSGEEERIKDHTVAAYVQSLARLMIVEDQPAWTPHLRSSHQLRTSASRHFVDPSIAVAALGATPASLRADLNTFGLLFESLVIRDLRIYSQRVDGQVSHYRDSGDLEVDAIVSTYSGSWAAFEVKLGASEKILDGAAANLLRVADRVDTAQRGVPVALGVIVGTGYGYVRPDGVHVIPIGALSP